MNLKNVEEQLQNLIADVPGKYLKTAAEYKRESDLRRDLDLSWRSSERDKAIAAKALVVVLDRVVGSILAGENR